jgi:hypothetical protein
VVIAISLEDQELRVLLDGEVSHGLNRDAWARYVAGLPYQATCPG